MSESSAWWRRSRPASRGSLARLAETMAVLLEAGVAPAAAWRHLADVIEPPAAAARAAMVGEALARGEPGAQAIGRRPGGGTSAGDAVLPDEWRQLAAAWQVAEQTGAPLAPCLRAFADAARATAQARRQARVALAGPETTARLVLALPLVGLVFGSLVGLDTVGVVVTTPIGWFCASTAAGLVVLARLWNRRLVVAASPPATVPGLALEILAMAVGGGGSWPAARRATSTALAEFCPGIAEDPHTAPVVDRLVALSEAAGCPAAALLRSAADDDRRDAAEALQMAAERLGVMLMLPLGLCVLPAFVLVGVVPLGVALLSSTAVAS